MRDRNEQTSPSSSVALALALLGLAALSGSIVLGLLALFGSQSTYALAVAVYLAGSIAMTVVTAGARIAQPLLWTLRLATPLLGSALVVALRV